MTATTIAGGEVRLPELKLYSLAAINCVQTQRYPADKECWAEALDLMSFLSGVDMTDESHNLIMADPRALSLAKASGEMLDEHLKRAFPTEAERSAVLAGAPTDTLSIARPS